MKMDEEICKALIAWFLRDMPDLLSPDGRAMVSVTGHPHAVDAAIAWDFLQRQLSPDQFAEFYSKLREASR